MFGAPVLRRSRALAVLLILLGAWGAIVPFIGPYFGYAYSPDKAWQYTSGRLWLSVVPGAAALLGGVLILIFARAAWVGGLLAALGGAWLVLGQSIVALAITSGSISAGSPVASSGAAFGSATMKFLEGLGFFFGLGVLIVFLAALALGRAGSVKAATEAEVQEAIDREGEYGAAY